MFNLDQAVTAWRQQMAAGGIEAPEVLEEFESHLRDDVEQQVRSGLSVQQAFEVATNRIGQATALRAEFRKMDAAKRLQGRKRLWGVFGLALGLFIAIVGVCRFVLLPLTFRANAQYASWMGIHGPQASFGFVCRFALGLGLALAMPVGFLTLVRIGILNHWKLASLRRYMIVANLIIGAVLTTPEVVTQIVMFVPLQLLCEASIWIAWFWERKELKPS